MTGRPKRIAVVTLGTRGDVDPALALAAALKQAGYDVVFGAPIAYEAEARAEGLEFRPLKVDMRAMMHSPETKAFLSSNILIQLRDRRRLSRDMDRAAVWDLYEAVKDADAIVCHILLTFALDIAEVRGLPAIVYAMQPIAPTRSLPVCSLPFSSLGGFLNRATYEIFRLNSVFLHRDFAEARATLLNAPPRPRWKHPAHINGAFAPSIFAASPALFSRPADWPQNALQTGFWFRPSKDQWTPDARLAAFLKAGPPPIYVGFGSMPLPRAEEAARILAAALDRAGLRAVVSRGWAEFAPDETSDRLCLIDSAPHDKLFPLLAAVVHHGGAGTTATGLRAARPTLVCPIMVDQGFWGRRVTAIGAGPRPLRVKHWTVETLAERLADLVRNPAYAAGAAKVAQAMAREDGVADAVGILREAFGPP